jgi:hypothetical protein
MSSDVVHLTLTAQSISYYICLSGVILYFQIIVLNQLKPSYLSEVEFFLSEYVFQAFVIRECNTSGVYRLLDHECGR